MPDAAPADLDQVAPRFLANLRDSGFTETPEVPLTSADPTVTFINATITPFKPRLLAGDRIGRTCQVQQCLRSRGRYPWLYMFGMIGALTDAEHLPVASDAVPRALLTAAPWMATDHIDIAVDEADGDLGAFLERAPSLAGARIHSVRHEDVPTRWSYGKDGRLTGRGMTFFYRYPEPCGPECAPGCRCDRQELGQIIEVTSPLGQYIEAGFGVETVQVTTVNGDLYQLPWLRAECDRLRAAGLPDGDVPQIVNLARTIAPLVEEGATPGGKGAGHVMRRFILELIDLVGEDDWRERVREVCASAPVSDAVIAEGERRERSRQAAVSAASGYLRRHPDASADDLMATYGLTTDQANQILAGRSG